MPVNDALGSSCATGPSEAPTTQQVRDRMAVRSETLDREHPEVLDLEAAVVGAMAEELRGVASLLSGGRSPAHFREALRGERVLHLDNLCRLATSHRPEARRATLAALQVLARAVDLRLVPFDPDSVPTLSVIGQALVRQSSELVGLLIEALDDGEISEREDASLANAEADLHRVMAALHAARIKARGQR